MNTYITGATIKRLREMKGLTQQQLAEEIGVSSKAISKWETAKGLPDDCALVAICGKNKKLLSSLNALSKKRKNIIPVGFTKEIPTYMDASELIVTKAGGLSSTEAGVKHLPIVFSNAIPGLETHNRDYFVSRGFAFYGETPDVISAVVNTVIASDALLSDMRARMAAEFTHRSAREIVDFVHENKTI